MDHLRIHGEPPFSIVVIHGGPGAPGYMAPVARELSLDRGVLEPLQTSSTIEGQMQELKSILEKEGTIPVTLIGSSWGAWLSFIFSSKYPYLVKKLVIIGSGPFEEKYASKILEIRLGRLNEQENREVFSLMAALEDSNIHSVEKNTFLSKLGNLFTKADAYNPATLNTEIMNTNFHIYQGIWGEASKLRQNGTLLALGKQIKCPVTAIHGDYDPHPPEGVQKPLSSVLTNFQFILIKNCGHLPWIEKQAKDEFYKILKKEL